MPSSEKSFWEHLLDLKNLVFQLFAVWAIFTLGTIYFSEELLAIFVAPLKGTTLHFLSATDGLFFLVKIHALAGLIAASPVLTFLIWRFVHLGLETKEKRFLVFYTFAILLLTLVGILYGYLSIIPISLQFLLGISPEGTNLILTASEYTSFLISLLFSLVLVFQTPILVFGLIKSDLVKVETITSKRKYIYFFLVVVLAMLTPPDIFSLLLTFVPMTILLEGSIALASIGKSQQN